MFFLHREKNETSINCHTLTGTCNITVMTQKNILALNLLYESQGIMLTILRCNL